MKSQHGFINAHQTRGIPEKDMAMPKMKKGNKLIFCELDVQGPGWRSSKTVRAQVNGTGAYQVLMFLLT